MHIKRSWRVYFYLFTLGFVFSLFHMVRQEANLPGPRSPAAFLLYLLVFLTCGEPSIESS